MDLVNRKVVHGTFGEGNIVNHNGKYLKVDFIKSGSKKFVYPDVFQEYMKLVDKEVASIVEEKIEEVEEKRKEKESQLERERKIEEERRDILRRERAIKNRKIHPASQSVFWCQPEEEEEIFTEWKIFVGKIKSGERKGEPRRLARMDRNSVCLLTKRIDDDSEKNRQIIGAFMVDVNTDENSLGDGYIPARSEYRIQLSEQESKKMLFWNYYLNKKEPSRIVWKSGRQRYFDNIWMAQILSDILALRKDSKQEEDVRLFYEYFCQINSINMDTLPEANGPLLQSENQD